VTAGGQVFCWGSNAQGAVGVESSANGPVLPTLVPGVTARFVVAGDAFTCAGGTPSVWCWGRNQFGELGANPGQLARSSSPRLIADALAMGDSLDALHAGGFSACARGGRGVRCWGRTDLGAIPGQSPTSGTQPSPVEVPHYLTALPMLAHLNQCSVDATDALRCWGANDLGASGNGSVNRATTPPSAALPFAVQRFEGRPVVGQGSAHTCALDPTGVLRCWGARYFGQLGDGRLALVPTPVEVPALQGAVALAAGRAFTCARRATAPELTCVGSNNVGQLGGSSAASAPLPTTEPVPVTVVRDRLGGPPLSSVTRMSVGRAHTCAITAQNGLVCWGYNLQGQINPALLAANVYSGAVEPIAGITAINVAAGASHTCAVDRIGTLRCWGSNDRGESGQATVVVRATGMAVAGLTGVTAVAAGSAFTCARSASGRVDCFGANEFGQCGTGAALPSNITLTKRRAAIESGAAEVAVGAQHACARVGTEVWCWGANHLGQLGAAVATPPFAPQAARVAGLGPADEVRAGGLFSCARVGARVWCWGAHHRGQLGDGTLVDRSTPVEVLIPHSERVVELATGEEHTCARMLSGRVYCWGSNHLAQLALRDPLWIPRAEQGAVRWPR
jgi:alpha-tubulin suppressor-like RCC1 family protein